MNPQIRFFAIQNLPCKVEMTLLFLLLFCRSYKPPARLGYAVQPAFVPTLKISQFCLVIRISRTETRAQPPHTFLVSNLNIRYRFALFSGVPYLTTLQNRCFNFNLFRQFLMHGGTDPCIQVRAVKTFKRRTRAPVRRADREGPGNFFGGHTRRFVVLCIVAQSQRRKGYGLSVTGVGLALNF